MTMTAGDEVTGGATVDGGSGEGQGDGNHEAGASAEEVGGSEGEEAHDEAAATQETEGEEGHAEAGEEHDELPKDANEAVRRAFGRKTEQARKARERAEAAERERDELKSESERVRSTVGNEVVMRAAEVAGVHPETITESEAKAITAFSNARAWRDIFDAAGDTDEGWTGPGANGQTITLTPTQCRQEARRLSRQIEENHTARRAIERAGDEMKTLFDLGRAAKKAGITVDALKTWKPGKAGGAITQRPAVPNAATVIKRTPPAVPNAAGARRPNSGASRGSQNVDWAKVGVPAGEGKPGLSLLDAIQREERAKYGR